MKTIKQTCNIRYAEPKLPPRCRKWRNVEVEREHTATFMVVKPTEAPVAILRFKGVKSQLPEHGTSEVTEYRSFDDRLFVPCNYRRFVCTSEHRPATLDDIKPADSCWWGHATQEEVQDRLDKMAKRYVIIKGQVYEEIGEPRYVVMTFGLGGNHGGTAVMTDHYYNSNIAGSRYFRLDEREKAVRAGTNIAKGRGDTNDLPMTPHDQFRIIIREAIKIQPSKEAGPGDPFLNQLYNVTKVKDPVVAGFGVLAATFRS